MASDTAAGPQLRTCSAVADSMRAVAQAGSPPNFASRIARSMSPTLLEALLHILQRLTDRRPLLPGRTHNCTKAEAEGLARVKLDDIVQQVEDGRTSRLTVRRSLSGFFSTVIRSSPPGASPFAVAVVPISHAR